MPHICSTACNPGTCETQHRILFGWDAVEDGARFDRDNA